LRLQSADDYPQKLLQLTVIMDGICRNAIRFSPNVQIEHEMVLVGLIEQAVFKFLQFVANCHIFILI